MLLFLKVYFWVAVVVTVLRFITLGFSPYPREISRGADAISLLISLPFIAWAAYLVWG